MKNLMCCHPFLLLSGLYHPGSRPLFLPPPSPHPHIHATQICHRANMFQRRSANRRGAVSFRLISPTVRHGVSQQMSPFRALHTCTLVLLGVLWVCAVAAAHEAATSDAIEEAAIQLKYVSDRRSSCRVCWDAVCVCAE